MTCWLVYMGQGSRTVNVGSQAQNQYDRGLQEGNGCQEMGFNVGPLLKLIVTISKNVHCFLKASVSVFNEFNSWPGNSVSP